jgi:hypothetical protein
MVLVGQHGGSLNTGSRVVELQVSRNTNCRFSFWWKILVPTRTTATEQYDGTSWTTQTSLVQQETIAWSRNNISLVYCLVVNSYRLTQQQQKNGQVQDIQQQKQ